MSTISVPLPINIEESLNNLVKSGYGSNKADVVRRAITRLAEEEAINKILLAQKEPGLRGNLCDLARKLK